MFITKYSHLSLLAGGALIGTLGVRILRSRDAKKVYSFATAAVLREKDHIMEVVTDAKADCGDILADAKARNEQYAELDAQMIEDRAAKKNTMDAAAE